jgi:hypothetical protein
MNEKDEKDVRNYLHGYKEGFHAALKIAWAHAEELLISVDNTDKDKVREYITKLKS